ncbi:hypothetical protein EGW08_018893, partial [Elysia chlorotica]
MTLSVTAMFVLAIGLAASEKVCFPPKAEYKILTMVSLDDLYMACDYDEGRVIITPANDTNGDMWTMVDLKNKKTYFQPREGKCMFKECPGSEMTEKCLPENAQFLKTIDGHDLYGMTSTAGISWVLGVTKIEGSDLYH